MNNTKKYLILFIIVFIIAFFILLLLDNDLIPGSREIEQQDNPIDIEEFREQTEEASVF